MANSKHMPISSYILWVVLALPLIPIGSIFTSGMPDAAHVALHPTGEFAARFMIIAMMATPLTMLLPGWRGPRWLVRNRGYIGVAAFGYALFHTVLYVVDASTLDRVLTEASRFDIWTGWLAFLIFIPLAATSMDAAIRALGRRWKSLQRWVYAAAVLTLLHWAALHDWGGVAPAVVHFAPLALLSVYRVWRNVSRTRRLAF